MNCELLRWDINEIVDSLDKGELDYDDLMYRMSIAGNVERSLDPSWNSLEYYREGET
ncbi:MAG: glycosyl transferase, partial [Anaerolineae bacterium]|nr:glycosyl transferase [Anaerolineae bacterium]